MKASENRTVPRKTGMPSRFFNGAKSPLVIQQAFNVPAAAHRMQNKSVFAVDAIDDDVFAHGKTAKVQA